MILESTRTGQRRVLAETLTTPRTTAAAATTHSDRVQFDAAPAPQLLPAPTPAPAAAATVATAAAPSALDDNPLAGIPERALTWIALAPMWTSTLAEKTAFPTDKYSVLETWQRLARLGLCTVFDNRDDDGGKAVTMPPETRDMILDDLRRDPQRGPQHIAQEMAAAGAAILKAREDDTRTNISPVILRWATFAAHATDDDGLAGIAEEKISPMLEEGRTQDATRWIEAAEVVNHQLGGAADQTVGWARRALRGAQAENTAKRVEEMKSNLDECVERGATAESLAWAALITTWTPDMCLAAGFPARNGKAEFTFEPLEAAGMASMEDDQAVLYGHAADAIFDYLEEHHGKDFLAQQMVACGSALLAARGRVDIEPAILQAAELYTLSATPAEAARCLKAHPPTAGVTGWEFGAARLDRVLGRAWRNADANALVKP
jgi:hypothetical protein